MLGFGCLGGVEEGGGPFARQKRTKVGVGGRKEEILTFLPSLAAASTSSLKSLSALICLGYCGMVGIAQLIEGGVGKEKKITLPYLFWGVV